MEIAAKDGSVLPLIDQCLPRRPMTTHSNE